MKFLIQQDLVRVGGQVVSVLAFISDDLSSNPAEGYNFFVKLLMKRTKNKQKVAVVLFWKQSKFGPYLLHLFSIVTLSVS